MQLKIKSFTFFYLNKCLVRVPFSFSQDSSICQDSCRCRKRILANNHPLHHSSQEHISHKKFQSKFNKQTIMPRFSARALLLKELAEMNAERREASFIRHLHALPLDETADDIQDDSSTESDMDFLYESLEDQLKNQRYLTSRTHCSAKQQFPWEDCINDNSETFTVEQFLYFFRCTRPQFRNLHSKIHNHPIFVNSNRNHSPGGRKRKACYKQLLVFLHRAGQEGSGANCIAIANFFKIGKGSVTLYVSNVVKAINSLHSDYLRWPMEDARRDIGTRIAVDFGFRLMVGIIDGTLVFLDQCPLENGEAYFSRKQLYALTFLVVCDDQRNILYVYGGYPGSTHDNRMWKECSLFRNRDMFFSRGEYLAGDAAFSKSNVMVQTFKRVARRALTSIQEFFNYKLSSVRVISEHTIGILKGRFPCLKKINIKVKDGEDVKKICDMFKACSIIHNIFNQDKENNNLVPQEWYDETARNIQWASEMEPVEIDDAQCNGDARVRVFQEIINEFHDL